jgi:hypothetical protein
LRPTGAKPTRSPDVDTASGSIVGRIGVDAPAFNVSYGLGSIWVATGNNELIAIDPKAHSITGRLSFPAGQPWMSVGEGAVWVASQGTAYRIER